MKKLFLSFVIVVCSFVCSFFVGISHAETLVKKIDRSAQEAVDEVKVGAKTIVRKLKQNTNSEKDPVLEESKKKSRMKE